MLRVFTRFTCQNGGWRQAIWDVKKSTPLWQEGILTCPLTRLAANCLITASTVYALDQPRGVNNSMQIAPPSSTYPFSNRGVRTRMNGGANGKLSGKVTFSSMYSVLVSFMSCHSAESLSTWCSLTFQSKRLSSASSTVIKLSPSRRISCSSFISLRVRTWVQCCRFAAGGGITEPLVALLPPVCCFSFVSLLGLSGLTAGLSLPDTSKRLALISGVLRMLLVSLLVLQCFVLLFFWLPLVPFSVPWWWCFGSSVSRSCSRIRPIFRKRVAICDASRRSRWV